MCASAQNGTLRGNTIKSMWKWDVNYQTDDYRAQGWKKNGVSSHGNDPLTMPLRLVPRNPTGKRGIQVRGVSKEFTISGVRAVDGVTFDADPGEVVGLLGANGAGKTTIVKMLSTVLRPTSGRISVGGYDTVADSRHVRANIGVLFGGDTGLYDRLSARENIYFFAALNGLNRKKCAERLEELTDIFGLGDFMDRLVATFSSGMKQRTALARTVIHDPSILILDEPTTALDIDTTLLVHTFVSRSRDKGKTVILSSHDTTELEKLSDRVLTIEGGKIVDEAYRSSDFRGDGGSLRTRFLALRSVAQ